MCANIAKITLSCLYNCENLCSYHGIPIGGEAIAWEQSLELNLFI